MVLTIVAIILVMALAVILVLNLRAPEKRLGRKIERHYALRDSEFQREMSVLLGPTILEGNQVTLLQNGDEIFPAILASIQGAQQTINFETYIYWSGNIGTELSTVLAERARAGVVVNVMVDWAGSFKIDEVLVDTMVQAGVNFQRFRPLKWYSLGRLNNRTHRKLLIVDGRIGFTGGVGIADDWLGDAQDPEHWRDNHFRVDGPVVAQLQAAFNDNWIKTTGTVLNGDRYFPHLIAVGFLRAQVFVASPAGGSESMHLMYLMAIAAATTSIDLQAAYFVPDALIVKAILAARRRNVRIRVVVPGEHIDSTSVKFASRAHWGVLLAAGIELSLYRPTMMHNKLLIIDREMVSMGSTNFDQRSFMLNEEACLNVYDRGFASQMTDVFERDLQRAECYGIADWRARRWKDRFLESIFRPIQSQL